jgi:predicted dienelactone hydrolase
MGKRITVFALALLFAKFSFAAVGFQRVTVPDPQGKPIAAAIWYPSDAQASPHSLELFTQTVAIDGKVSGKDLPLIVISHGAYGNLASHYDTALALARAGFVVVAFTQTGDNSSDQSYIGNRIDLTDRPRQVKTVLDWMLSSWTSHGDLDPKRVGMFGFSLGGFTALVEVGGTPELARMALLCSTHPDAPECAFIKNSHGNQLEPSSEKPVWTHAPEIRAAVVAAPAVAFLFGPGDLRQVRVPVQLWRVEKDSSAPDQWNSGMIRNELPNRPEMHAVPDADHYAFLAPCSKTLAAAAPEICQDPPGFDRAAFHLKFNASVVAFFQHELAKR